VLDLSENTHGNAIGVGHADLIPQRLREKIDLAATYKNALTSHNLAGGKIPIVLPTDREVVTHALAGVLPESARVVYIRNTLELDQFWVSSALREDVIAHPRLEITGYPLMLEFDDAGALIRPGFASQRGG
jgi:hypothetical protein